MTAPIMPWPRPAFRPTGRRATVMLVAFADDTVSGVGPDLGLSGVVPAGAPIDALEVRLHRYSDSAAWIDGWRSGPFRHIAATHLGEFNGVDAATCCYSIRVDLDDPADLTHLQLAWAVAGKLAEAGTCATLDVYAATWHAREALIALSPHRPFTVRQEVSLIAETASVAGFGHPVHTRGMIKLGRPDLIAGVPADQIEETGRILNHLAQGLAEGRVLTPGQQLRVDHHRTLLVTNYAPDAETPDVNLARDGLLLRDV